jgi:hypothetical protein
MVVAAVHIDLDPRSWVEVPQDRAAGASAAWSREVAQRVWREAGPEPSTAELDRLSAAISELARQADDTAADHAYILLRGPTDAPVLVLLTVHPAAGDRAKALRQLLRSDTPAGADDLPEQVTRINSRHLGQGVRLRRQLTLSPGTSCSVVDYAFRSAAAHADVHLCATYRADLASSPGPLLIDLFAKSVSLDGSAASASPVEPAPGAPQNPLHPILEQHDRYARDQRRGRSVQIGHRVVIAAFAVAFAAGGIVQTVSHWNALPSFVWLWTVAAFGPLTAFWLCQRPEQRTPGLMYEIQGLALILAPLTIIGAIARPLPGAVGLAADATTLAWTSAVRRRERPRARR